MDTWLLTIRFNLPTATDANWSALKSSTRRPKRSGGKRFGARIHEVLLGSFTQKLIEASHLPVYLFH
ncbi:hypothetical protein Mal15_47080 [Stieleria maiorica]|uniref:Uncharacterized protein n=1 Tax=Stieleria maiorica TaxID=2795974 RepID=A0A5B9MKV9_9BACT|nr:hypothetical protein Mal15_47080 [Stieleria maiorica]